MTPPDALKAIQNGQFQPVYYLFGQEAFFLDQLVDALRERVVAPGTADFNLDQLYGSDVKPAQLTAAIRAAPMMAERRLVLVKEAQRIPKAAQTWLADYLPRATPTTVLVLVASGRHKPDGRSAYGKALTKHATVVEGKPLYDDQVPRWLAQELDRRTIRYEPEVPNLLAAAVGANLGALAQELQKIELHLRAKGITELTKAQVYDLVSLDRQHNVFELINAVADRRVQDALVIAHRLVQNPKEAPAVLLVGQLMPMWLGVRRLQANRVTQAGAAAKLLGLPMPIAARYLEAAKRYTPQDVEQALQALDLADRSAKGLRNTRMPERHTVLTLVAQLVQGARRAA